MRAIKVVLLDDEQAQVTPEKVYMGEHRAARLEIGLPARLRTGFDYYNLCFDVMGAGKRVPLGNIYEPDPVTGEFAGLAYVDNGEIVCELPESLTQCSYLRVQVEACSEEDGVCTRLEKSVPFLVTFEDSVAGEGDALSALVLGHTTRLMAQLNRLRRTLKVQVQGAQDAIGPLVDRAEQAADRAEQAAADTLALSATPGPQGPMGPKGDKGDKGDPGAGGGDPRTPAVDILADTSGSTILLQPEVRNRITFQSGATGFNFVLDDSLAQSGYAQKFTLVFAPVGGMFAPMYQLEYLSGRAILYADGSKGYEPKSFLEMTIVDGLAASNRFPGGV